MGGARGGVERSVATGFQLVSIKLNTLYYMLNISK